MFPYLWSLSISSPKNAPRRFLLWVDHLMSLENSTRPLSFCKMPTYFAWKPLPSASLMWCPPIVTWKISPPPLLLQGCESQLGGGVLHPQARCERGNLQLRPAVLVWIFSGRVMPETEWLSYVKNLGKCHQEIIHIEENLGTKLTIFIHACCCFLSAI